MVINDKHKFLFVELPRTASTAIAKELCSVYNSRRILNKHSTYEEFLSIATPEQKTYFVFSGIRNPLDDVVSIYYKYKNNRKDAYTRPDVVARRDPLLRFIDKKRFDLTYSQQISFPMFFMKFYRIPYSRWSELSHGRFDFIIRFEHLQEDFSKLLKLINIEQHRELPLVNRTTDDKAPDFISYYTPETIERAKRVFGPFMKKWNYSFPPHWGPTDIPWWNQVEFQFFNLLRRKYYKYRILRNRWT